LLSDPMAVSKTALRCPCPKILRRYEKDSWYLLNKLGNVDAETCFGLAETGPGRQKRQQVGASIPPATDGDYLPLNIEMIRLLRLLRGELVLYDREGRVTP